MASPARRRRAGLAARGPREQSPVTGWLQWRWFAPVVVAVFAVAYSLLQIASYTQKSATWDEPIHLTSGYVELTQGDYRFEATHPPFMRMWAALPLLFMSDLRIDTSVVDRMTAEEWVSGTTAYDLSTRFVYVDNDAERLLNAARFMIVIWGIVLGVLVFCWTYEWLGRIPAVCALGFYTLSPNILANASLVTTDLGITCFIFGTIYFLWRTCRRMSAWNLGGLTLFFALAIVTKYSALILGPLVVVLLGVAVAARTVTPRSAVAIVILLATASALAVWAVCGFRYAPSAMPSWVLHLEGLPLARTVPTLARITAWIDARHLLPNVFTEGFLIFAQSMQPPNSMFLAGQYSNEGWWYYFPVAFAMKTPVPMLVLMVIGIVAYARRWYELGVVNELFVAVSICVYLAAAMMSQFQVGVRHILPLYPFVVMIAAAGASELVRRRPGRFTLAGLVAFWIATVGTVYPNTLTFFNRLVGGPAERLQTSRPC